ncbi:MAG: hypothetical protein NZM05_00715 [Chloroherpetonaceae bacterium]|nr:hypothetical protein [Chloroherpetonaceae bacterium]
MRRIWGSLSLILLVMQGALAQPVATVSLSPDTCTIGDEVFYTIQVLKKPSVQMQYPAASDSLVFYPFEVRQMNRLPDETREELRLESVRYTLTVFDTGMQVVPPIRLTYFDEAANRADSLWLGAQKVYVRSLLDTARKDIVDIKPVRSVPVPAWIYVLGGALLLAVAVGIYLLVRYWRHRPMPMPTPTVENRPAKTPYQIASEKLQSLADYSLRTPEDYKTYYTLLSDTVREFLENYYNFNAREQLTSEICAVMEMRRPPEEVGRIRRLLETADLVKFAKFQPEFSEAKESWALAYQIIEVAKPVEPAPTTNLAKTP